MVVDKKVIDRKKLQHLLFIGLFFLIEILLIRRSFYGFNTADVFLECELSWPFKERGYHVVYKGNGTVMMSPERAEHWQHL